MDDRILLGLVVGGVTGVVGLLYTYGKEQFEHFLTKRNENQIKKEKQEIENQPINRNLKSIENLEDLRDSGLLTEREYQEKVEKLRDKILLEKIKDKDEYKKLKDLFEKGILTIDEFEDKINILKTISNKPIEIKKNPNSEKCSIIINHKKTSFDKDLGYYKTFEVLSNNKNLDKFMFNQKYEEELFFLKDKLELGYFDSIVNLIKKVNGIDVIIDE